MIFTKQQLLNGFFCYFTLWHSSHLYNGVNTKVWRSFKTLRFKQFYNTERQNMQSLAFADYLKILFVLFALSKEIKSQKKFMSSDQQYCGPRTATALFKFKHRTADSKMGCAKTAGTDNRMQFSETCTALGKEEQSLQ